MAEALPIPLPASEHSGLLSQLKASFDAGHDLQKEAKKEKKLKDKEISDTSKRAAMIAGKAYETTKGLLKGIDNIANYTVLGYSLAKKSFTLAQRSAKAALRGAGKLAGEGLAAGGKKIAGVAKSIMDLLLDGAIMVGIFGLLKLFESGGMEWLTLAKDTLVGIYEWFKLLFTDPKAAMEQAWQKITNGMASLGQWIYDNALLPVWNWFSDLFPGTADTMAKLFAGIATVAGNLGDWIYDNAIKPVWDWISLLFDDPKTALDQLFGAVVGLGTWVYNNAIKPVWDWFGTLFTSPMTAIEQYFKFVGNVGKFIYDEAIKPVWDWFGETFPGAKQALLDLWKTIFVDSSIGSYIFKEVLEPLWNWFGTLFTNPREALEKAWTFFKSFPTWIMDTVFTPLWTWFSGKFPDIAEPLSKLFTAFTSLSTWFFDNVISPPWEFIKGLFKFGEEETGVKKEDFSIIGMIQKLANTVWGYIKGLFGFAEEAAPDIDETELEKAKSKFSITGMITGLIDKIVGFFKGLFDFDVMKIMKDIFGALGDAGARAWNFVFGGDDKDEKLETAADMEKEEMVNATQAMAKLAQEFKTASLTAENIQLSDTAIAHLAKVLTSGEGATRSVVNNYFDNSSVTQSNASGSTIVNTKKESKNPKSLP